MFLQIFLGTDAFRTARKRQAASFRGKVEELYQNRVSIKVVF
jgi:hypothetical protein